MLNMKMRLTCNDEQAHKQINRSNKLIATTKLAELWHKRWSLGCASYIEGY